jgi:hypothetical protein
VTGVLCVFWWLLALVASCMCVSVIRELVRLLREGPVLPTIGLFAFGLVVEPFLLAWEIINDAFRADE